MNPAQSSSAEAAVRQAVKHQKAGQNASAEQIYRRALLVQPDHPEANHNLGIIMLQSGRMEAGLAHFETAFLNDPDRDLYRLSYARALLIAGRPGDASAVLSDGIARGMSGPTVDALMGLARAGSPDDAGARQVVPHKASGTGADVVDVTANEAGALSKLGKLKYENGQFAEAAALFRQAIELDPTHQDELLLNLGNALTEQGLLDEAIEAFQGAISLNPSGAEAHYHLGSILSENGRVADGFAHLMRHAELAYGSGAMPPADAPEPSHKIKHDREQRVYLASKGIQPPERATRNIFHIGQGGPVEGSAVNPANATQDLMQSWRSGSPQMVVIDNFLMPEALAKLRAYCAESTIWRRVYEAGYIGATPPDGFACPLLAQIAEEIRGIYQGILGRHPFQYLGAFKYDSELSTGTNTHADFSAINVNFYLADDHANLDARTGGMVVWNVEAQSEAEMRRYNSDESALRAHLKRRGAKACHVPHRCNRAIIFKSALFHKTDDCHFKEGYLNKRINVSLLFGKWSDAAA
jgi:tetratricopeptide (TPR) repeat protein